MKVACLEENGKTSEIILILDKKEGHIFYDALNEYASNHPRAKAAKKIFDLFEKTVAIF